MKASEFKKLRVGQFVGASISNSLHVAEILVLDFLRGKLKLAFYLRSGKTKEIWRRYRCCTLTTIKEPGPM